MNRDWTIELAQSDNASVISYLKKDVIRNALNVWYLQRGEKGFELHVCRVGDEVKAHLSIYATPEATYIDLGGDSNAAKSLLPLVPEKAVLMTTNTLRDQVTSELKFDKIYSNDIMVVKRGEEKLKSPNLATRLSRKHDVDYSAFGASFNVPVVPIEWIRERLENDIVYGAFANSTLASVASLVAWLPEVAVIMGVETKPEFRGRGLGSIAVSATVREALKLSQCCNLFVRSDNEQAIGLYRALGFKKIGEELWIDIGTGLVP
ncbi:MAG: GNAT family N-acetyltransferase [Nitrososphaerota archaeon]|nr:GNAT family N-acetyltransferase [Nitrososphaerota archaeon]